MTAKRQYPYSAFVLTPSMAVKEVTLVRGYYASPDWDQTAMGKTYHIAKLHQTPAAAIEAGKRQLIEQEAKIEKQKATIAKCRANLAKAEGASA
jgi:hypothetical protein